MSMKKVNIGAAVLEPGSIKRNKTRIFKRKTRDNYAVN